MKLFTPLLLLIIAGALFFLYIDPTYARVKELLASQGSLDEALSRSKDLLEARDRLLSRYNTFPPSEIARLEKMLPDHIDNVRLILDLDSMAAKYGMRVRGVSTQSDQSVTKPGELGPDERPFESVVLSFTISGPYTTFRQFLTDLEQSLRLTDVVGVEFSANEVGVYDYTVRIKTYWLKP